MAPTTIADRDTSGACKTMNSTTNDAPNKVNTMAWGNGSRLSTTARPNTATVSMAMPWRTPITVAPRSSPASRRARGPEEVEAVEVITGGDHTHDRAGGDEHRQPQQHVDHDLLSGHLRATAPGSGRTRGWWRRSSPRARPPDRSRRRGRSPRRAGR